MSAGSYQSARNLDGGRDGPKIPQQSTVKEVKRKLSNTAERAELELNVAGTEFAELERSVFKATKVNFKVPKEKHVQRIFRSIDDPNSSRITLRILARRLREANQTVTVLKTLVVWHRCLRSGDSTFTELCAPYANSILSLNNFNDKTFPDIANFSRNYAKFLKQKLHTFEKTKYEYDKETEWGDSRTKGLDLRKLLDELPHLVKLVELLFACDFVRAPNLPLGFSMAFELLIRDSSVLCRAIDQGMQRLLGMWDEMEDYDMLKTLQLYRNYSKHLKSGLTWMEVLEHYSAENFEGVSGQISSSKLLAGLQTQQDRMRDVDNPRNLETLEEEYERVRTRKKLEESGEEPPPVPAKKPPPPVPVDDFDPRAGLAVPEPAPAVATPAADPAPMFDLLSLDDPAPQQQQEAPPAVPQRPAFLPMPTGPKPVMGPGVSSPAMPFLPQRQPPQMPGMGMAQPGTMQPGMMQPGMMQPGMMQPGMMQPGMMQPGMMQQWPQQ